MDKDNITHHLFILGTSGKGRSSFIGEPQQASLFDDLPNNTYQSPKENKEEQRLTLIKHTYWNASLNIDPNLYEFATIHDSLVEFLNMENPSLEEQKVVFDLLPQYVIGLGISWGFDDTEVRDKIYVFVRENVELIQKQISININ